MRLVNLEKYKQRLLGIEKELSARVSGDTLETDVATPGDAGDRSVADISASDHFTEAELNTTLLTQVRDALARIGDGTFGKCIVDGAPIPAKRLEAVPWSPYCLKHQELLEAAAQPRTFT